MGLSAATAETLETRLIETGTVDRHISHGTSSFEQPQPGWDEQNRTLFVRPGEPLIATTAGDVDATVVILNGRPIEALKLDLLHRPFPRVDLAESLRPESAENFLTVQVWNRRGSTFDSRVEITASGEGAVSKVFHKTGWSREAGLAFSESMRIVVLRSEVTVPVPRPSIQGRAASHC